MQHHRRSTPISDFDHLMARAEAALDAIEARQVEQARARDAERARLARIEAAAAQTVAALDDLIAAEG